MLEIQFPFFTTRQLLHYGLLLTLLACPTRTANACDDVLGLCLKTYGPGGGALVTTVTGTAAGNLFREGDRTRYKLIAGQHVIKAVNGNPTATKEEVVEALRQAAAGTISLDVLNIERGTTRTYYTRRTPGRLRTHNNNISIQMDSPDSAGSIWNTPEASNASDTSYLQNIGSRLDQDRFNLNYSRNRDHRSVYDN
jgi:hypothetical protein